MRLKYSVFLLSVVVSPLAMAQDDTSDDWNGEAELGLLITSGNSDETNINTRIGLKHEIARWRNTLELRTLYAEAEDETTSEKYLGEAETNYKFDERQFWFLRGAYEDDRFSGYQFQSSVTAGYGNRVWEVNKKTFLDLKAGAGYRYNKLYEPNDEGEREEDGAVARFAGIFNYELSENAVFIQELSTEVGLQDNSSTISESLTALKANLIGNLAMKLAYRVKHESQVPAGTSKTDTETSLSLLYGF